MLCYNCGTPALMLLADSGCPLLDKDQERVIQSRRTFCTLHGLLRWCRYAMSGGATNNFNSCFSSGPGQQLVIRTSSLPLELINMIAALADLQHNDSLTKAAQVPRPLLMNKSSAHEQLDLLLPTLLIQSPSQQKLKFVQALCWDVSQTHCLHLVPACAVSPCTLSCI